MSRTGQRPGSGNRTVTSDEAELWEQATRSLERVKAKPRVASSSPLPAPSPAPVKSRAGAAAGGERKPLQHRKPHEPGLRTEEKSSAHLATLDRREARRIAGGKAEIDARIDLHGLRQADAHARLRTFLFGAYAKGLKTVLVITGKGGDADASDHLSRVTDERQRGVLRRSVPLWLAQPDLGQLVLSYGAAGVRHGGIGALYVRLRKSPRSG
jgi:DNA-nicking Smr family endonuclease